MATRLTLVVILACALTACGDTEFAAETPPDASTTSLPATTIATTTSTSLPEQPDPTTAPVEPVAVGLPIESQLVVFGPDGIWAVSTDSELVEIDTAPTAIAFAVGDSLVISQGIEHSGATPPIGGGPITFRSPEGEAVFAGEDGERVRLLDVAIVESRVIAVTAIETGSGPEDTEIRLVLVDAGNQARSDLGVAGWWEAGISQADLIGDVIVTIQNASVDNHMAGRSLGGELLWEVKNVAIPDTPVALAAGGDSILVLAPGFDEDFNAFLTIDRYEPATGTLTSSQSLAVAADFGGGFCQSADWNGFSLICNESYGGPFALDLETGAVTRLPAPGEQLATHTVHTPPPPASQSPDAAARDGIPPEVAALPLSLRISQFAEHFGATRIEAPEGTWLVSILSTETMQGCGSLEPPEGSVCLGEYAEIVLLDAEDGTIVRAYPFQSLNPQELHLTDEAVYCIRQGDGALPDSMLCRIDRKTLDPTVRAFPFLFDGIFSPGNIEDGDFRFPAYWTIDDPVDYVLWEEMKINGEITITGWSGSATVDPTTLEVSDIEWAE